MRKQAIVFATLALALSACAAGDARFTVEAPAGFWTGIWHGLIAPVSFIVGLFSDTVGIYERHNTGSWYDFGFLLGIFCLGIGSHAPRRRRSPPIFPHGLPDSAHVQIDIDYEAKKPDDTTAT